MNLVWNFGRAEKKMSGLGNIALWTDGHDASLLLSRRPSGESCPRHPLGGIMAQLRRHEDKCILFVSPTTKATVQTSGSEYQTAIARQRMFGLSVYEQARWGQRYHCRYCRKSISASKTGKNHWSECANKPPVGDPSTSTQTCYVRLLGPTCHFLIYRCCCRHTISSNTITKFKVVHAIMLQVGHWAHRRNSHHVRKV